MIVEMQSLDKNELTHIVGGAGPLKWAWKLCRKFFSKRTAEVTSSSGAKHTLESGFSNSPPGDHPRELPSPPLTHPGQSGCCPVSCLV